VIAAQRVVVEPRIERVRTATRRRTRRTRRRLHAPVHAVVTLALAALLPLLGYVTLTANLTSLNDSLERAERDRAVLLGQVQRRDNRIAQLESPDQLAVFAAALHMHDPHVYAVVRVPKPKPQPQPSGLALFAWFNAR
jgi:hypothetical protein